MGLFFFNLMLKLRHWDVTSCERYILGTQFRPRDLRICLGYFMYTRKETTFPSPFTVVHTKVAPPLSLILLSIFSSDSKNPDPYHCLSNIKQAATIVVIQIKEKNLALKNCTDWEWGLNGYSVRQLLRHCLKKQIVVRYNKENSALWGETGTG